MTFWGASATAWAAWTAIGTLALAVVTCGALLATLRATKAERDRWRRERQMLDADLIADTDQLLMDVSPTRRGFNLDRAPGVESDRWATLSREATKISRGLVQLAAGHPDQTVQETASDLSSAVLRAATQSQWHISDMLANRDGAQSLETAMAEYEGAMTALVRLREAVKAAGAPKGTAWRRWQKSLPRGATGK